MDQLELKHAQVYCELNDNCVHLLVKIVEISYTISLKYNIMP